MSGECAIEYFALIHVDSCHEYISRERRTIYVGLAQAGPNYCYTYASHLGPNCQIENEALSCKTLSAAACMSTAYSQRQHKHELASRALLACHISTSPLT